MLKIKTDCHIEGLVGGGARGGEESERARTNSVQVAAEELHTFAIILDSRNDCTNGGRVWNRRHRGDPRAQNKYGVEIEENTS